MFNNKIINNICKLHNHSLPFHFGMGREHSVYTSYKESQFENWKSYLNLIGQLMGDIFSYCLHVIARAYSDATLLSVPIATRKLCILLQFLGVIPQVGQYGEIFRSRPRYRPSLQSGRYGRSRTEYFPRIALPVMQ